MESANLIHGICIKMGDYSKIPNYRFIKKSKSKKSLFNSLDQFFNLTIFEQSAGLASILVSLYNNTGENKELMQDINKLVRITDSCIEIKLNPEVVTYFLPNDTFDVDTNFDEPGGFKFVYGRKNFVPKSMSDIWKDHIQNKLEDRYLEIITCVSKTMNNPIITRADDSDLVYFDPFAD